MPTKERPHHLTRQDMEATIDQGGSVLHAGQVIVRKQDLPTEADLAGDDAAAKARARENLLAQKAAIEEQLAKVGEATAPASSKPSK